MGDKKIVTCSECRHFIHPESKYEPNSLGNCGYFDAWLNKFPGKRPPNHAQHKAFLELGNKMFMPYIERACVKFKGEF